MQNQIDLQPAYLLHSRPFRDSSRLLDFITPDFGRFSAIANGSRRVGAKNKGLLQPFTPIQISVSGKSELKTLRSVELVSDAFVLKGEQLYSALYINELMVRLVHANESEEDLFLEYERTLGLLQHGKDLEPILRCFEIALLDVIGYGIEFKIDASSGEAIVPDEHYYFEIDKGFSHIDISRANVDDLKQRQNYFPGKVIIQISEKDFSTSAAKKSAKKLLRYVLGIYMGPKPLTSRQLFTSTG